MSKATSMIESYGATDVGLVRLNNEDVWARLASRQLFVLADGMGGHAAGEVAAQETVRKICEWAKEIPFNPLPNINELIEDLEEAIKKTNEWVFKMASEEKNMAGMGTTLCLAWIIRDTLIAAHVGDSRLYRIRKGRLTLLTVDHSLRNDLLNRGEIDETEAQTFPYKNVITRAIGTSPTVTPEIHTSEVEKGDLYFLCSDGLSDPLNDTLMQDLIEETASLEEAANSLITAVKKAGGTDNITILLFKIPE